MSYRGLDPAFAGSTRGRFSTPACQAFAAHGVSHLRNADSGVLCIPTGRLSHQEDRMLRKQVKLILLSLALMSLTAGPLRAAPISGSPSALLRVARGIHAALATDCALYAAAYGGEDRKSV